MGPGIGGRSPGEMASQIDIPCSGCWENIPLVDADAQTFFCQHCGIDRRFRPWTAGESVNQVPAKATRASCEWCASEIGLGAFRRNEESTAEDWRAELDER